VTEVSSFYGTEQSMLLPPHMITETPPVSETLCFLVFRIADDETQWYCYTPSSKSFRFCKVAVLATEPRGLPQREAEASITRDVFMWLQRCWVADWSPGRMFVQEATDGRGGRCATVGLNSELGLLFFQTAQFLPTQHYASQKQRTTKHDTRLGHARRP
jgi:hypothetical protein